MSYREAIVGCWTGDCCDGKRRESQGSKSSDSINAHFENRKFAHKRRMQEMKTAQRTGLFARRWMKCCLRRNRRYRTKHRSGSDWSSWKGTWVRAILVKRLFIFESLDRKTTMQRRGCGTCWRCEVIASISIESGIWIYGIKSTLYARVIINFIHYWSIGTNNPA